MKAGWRTIRRFPTGISRCIRIPGSSFIRRAKTGRPDFYVRKTSAPGVSNPYVAAVGGGTVNAAAPFYNDFSSGTLKIQCDIRAYDGLVGSGSYVRIRPVYKKHLVPGAENTKVYATAFGVQNQSGGVQAVLLYGNGKGENQGLSTVAGVSKDHWYRYEIDLDLDRLRETGCVYDMGTDHPDIGSVGGKMGDFASDLKFNYNPSDEYGPISGILISMSRVMSDGPSGFDASIAPAVDNLVVSWKAPGAASFEKVYENDFGVRRYRSLSPAGTKTGAYAMGVSSYTEKFSCAYHSQRLDKESQMSALLATDSSKDVQPVGYDGWRRLNISGKSRFAAVDWSKNVSGGSISGEEGGAVVRVTGRKSDGSNNFGYAMVPIGESLTSGKVCLTADIRIPFKWTSTSLSRFEASVMLGDTAVYGATGISGHYALRGGITGNPSSGEKTTTRFQPFHSTVEGYGSYDDHPLTPTNWYRVALTADLDDRAAGSSMKVWKLGAQSKKSTFVPTELVFEKSGIPFKSSDFPDIGTIVLYASGAGINDNDNESETYDRHRFICFDNVVLTKNAGTPDERVVYSNVFSTRTRTLDGMTSGKLIGSFHNDDGTDHWIRRAADNGEMRVVPESADNPCAAAWSTGADGSYSVHPIGSSVKAGTVQVDMRPPASWNVKDASTRQTSAVFGGDDMLQGVHDVKTGHGIAYKSAMTFGFYDLAGVKDEVGVYTNMQIYAWNGDGATGGSRVYPTVSKRIYSTHWYRFRATFVAQTGTWSLEVFDMGKNHPAADAADGERIASQDGLGFRSETPDGISAVYLNARGNAPVLANDPQDAGFVLFDNIIATKDDSGMVLIIR